jgi:hypothetical protein
MKALLGWIEKYDIIGPEFNFERSGSSRFRTLQGSFLSIIILVSAIVLAFQFGQDIYERKLPSISSSKEFINTSEIYMKDFPVLLNFLTATGKNISLSNTLDVWVEEYIFDERSKITIKKHNIVKCKEMLPKFRTHQNLVSQLLTGASWEYYCFNFTENHVFKNEYAAPNSTFLRFMIRYCQKEERSDCNHDPVLLKDRLVISSTYVDYYVYATNYTNPVQPYINRIVPSLSASLTKFTFLYFTNNEFVSDNGWLVEDIKTTKYSQLSAQFSDVLVSKEYNNMIYQLTLTSPRLRVKDKRIYLKVQELFARIGGIMNGFIIVMTVLSYHYLRFKYLIFVWKNSFNIIDEEYVIKMRKENNFLNLIDKDNIK